MCMPLISENSSSFVFIQCCELFLAVGAYLGIKASERFACHSFDAAHDLACLQVRLERLVRARGCAGFRPGFYGSRWRRFLVTSAAAFLPVAVGKARMESLENGTSSFQM